MSQDCTNSIKAEIARAGISRCRLGAADYIALMKPRVMSLVDLHRPGRLWSWPRAACIR